MRERTALGAVFGLAAILLLPVTGSALEIDAFMRGWSMHIGPDRVVTVEVFPAAHLGRRFTLSVQQLEVLRSVLAREDFFSLSPNLGVLYPDGSTAEIQVRDGHLQNAVNLSSPPNGMADTWRSDVSQIGRALRVCEYLRSISGLRSASHCPGVPTDTKDP
jgi:hypothetical protein